MLVRYVFFIIQKLLYNKINNIYNVIRTNDIVVNNMVPKELIRF